jgi:XapX domain-containing protein
MSAWLLSLGAGILIGLLYALLKVRSPAPPAIALTGLLGMLLGGALVSEVAGRVSAAPVPHHAAAPVAPSRPEA